MRVLGELSPKLCENLEIAEKCCNFAVSIRWGKRAVSDERQKLINPLLTFWQTINIMAVEKIALGINLRKNKISTSSGAGDDAE